MISITGLILAAAIAEREQAERERERLVRERAEAEAQLRFAAIVESSEDAIISGTLDGMIVSWNPGAQRMYGYTEAEVVGKAIAILLPPELTDEENKIRETLRLGDRIEQLETTRMTKTGKRINVSLSISPIKDATGGIVGVSGIARNITERKLAEQALRESGERLRLAVQAGRMFAYSWDATSDVIQRSGESMEVLGIGPDAAATGEAVSAMIHPDDRGKVEVAMAKLSIQNPILQTAYRIVRPDGKIIWIERNSRAYFDSDAKVTRMVGMVVDVTERKLAEEAVADMSRKLIESQEQERNRIGRELHDDINQRLAMLAIELEQLMENPHVVGTRLQELREEVTEISIDVQALSHDLSSSKLEYLGAVAGMKSWCDEFAERQGMQIDCRHDVQSTLPREIGLCLFRVLQEACHNIAKHSGVKRVEVEFSEGASEIQLTIRDLGKGFDLETVKHKGLGLTSMKERVRLVNGTITIDSRPRCGTSIHVRVPFHAAKNAAQATA